MKSCTCNCELEEENYVQKENIVMAFLDHLLKLMCHFPMSVYLLKLLLFLYLRLTYHAH